MNTFNRNELHNILHSHIVTIVFEKANGELRELRCTLRPEHLPEQMFLTEDGRPARRVNPDVVAVWDIENLDWRSFRIDSIKRIIM